MCKVVCKFIFEMYVVNRLLKKIVNNKNNLKIEK